LVKRRRLGQTNLAVKPGQIGTSNATKPENLGVFDYAHLRAPLPKNIVSGIFKPNAPPSYFLMRRSHDGYISATGMFKATFPWAELAEEEAERKYIKGLDTTSSDETAGNVWIPPTHALQLAKEYKITPWIEALLDNEPIDVHNGRDATPKSISTPPKFLLPQESLAAPTPSRSGRPVRSTRSASPSKIASPKKTVNASPRKSKATKASTIDSHTSAANKSLQKALKQAATAGDDKVDSSEDVEEEPKVKVSVDQDVETKGETETTHTRVSVEMPAGSPELPLPEDTAAMIAKATEMVKAAKEADEAAKAESTLTSRPKKSKRKVEEIAVDEEVEEAVESGPSAKKTKVETELKTEKVKTRALLGLSATLAIG
jgi:hypothetical protein